MGDASNNHDKPTTAACLHTESKTELVKQACAKGGGAPSPAFDPLGDTIHLEQGGGSATRTLPPAERYELGAELGRGGMGRVVEAFDRQLGRIVALKEVLPENAAVAARRLDRE